MYAAHSSPCRPNMVQLGWAGDVKVVQGLVVCHCASGCAAMSLVLRCKADEDRWTGCACPVCTIQLCSCLHVSDLLKTCRILHTPWSCFKAPLAMVLCM